MEPIHEGLHEVYPGYAGGDAHLLCLRRVHSQRLLAQHVLACRNSTQRPLLVQAVDQRDVDRLHLRILEERLVRGAHTRDPMTRSDLLCPRLVSAGDRHEAPVAGGGDGGHHETVSDPRRAQHPPSEAPAYIWTSTWAPPRAIEMAAASITATVRRASSGGTASGSSHDRWSARLR